MQEDAEKRWDDSLLSLGIGALVVVISGILIYNYFSYQTPNILQKTQNVSVTSSPSPTTQMTVTAQESPDVSPQSYQAQNDSAQSTPQPVDSSTQHGGFLALPTTYTVVAGDSLWKLAEKFYGSGYEWRRIAEANKLTGSSTLAVGAQITIPRAELISAAATIRTPSPAVPHSPVAVNSASALNETSNQHTPSTPSTRSQAVAGAHSTDLSSETNPQPVPSPSTGQSFRVDGATITYTVKRGDSLWSIAASTCGDPLLWGSIARQNNLARPSVIHAGNVFTYTCSP